jgi:hypothetical protein
MARLKKDYASLYCGTTERVAKLAPVVGLNPDREPVYLSNVYPGLLAFYASTRDNERFGLIEVATSVLDAADFLPAEWYLQQASHKRSKTNREHHRRLEAYRRNLDKYRAKWKDSLQKLGICVYDGFVARKAIRRITVYDPASNPVVTQGIVDMRLTFPDYRKHFNRYQAITRWLAGESITAEDWLGEDYLTTPKDEREQLSEQLQNKSGLDVFFHEPPAKGP